MTKERETLSVEDTLKLALEAMKNAKGKIYSDVVAYKAIEVAITAAEEALAQPAVAEQHKQEPVFSFQMELHAPAGALIHPYPHVVGTPDLKSLFGKVGDRVTFYTTPPQRTWVHATPWRGLTDEETDHIIRQPHGGADPQEWVKNLAIALEAKLKEKNT